MLIKHIVATGHDVVSMIQVENEIGMLESARDHSKIADEIYKKGVPRDLVNYLKSHQEELHPWLKQRLSLPLSSSPVITWKEMFGDDIYTDEIFMAYYYARYVGGLCETARKYTQIPLYVNAALNSRGRLPGQYPSAGPLAHLIDLWHAGAPQLEMLAPDIYDTGFKGWAKQYALPNNRLLFLKVVAVKIVVCVLYMFLESMMLLDFHLLQLMKHQFKRPSPLHKLII